MNATVFLNFEDVTSLAEFKRVLVSFAALIIREYSVSRCLALPERFDELPASQFEAIKYWPFNKIVQQLISRLAPGLDISHTDVFSFIELNLPKIIEDRALRVDVPELHALATHYSIIVFSPFSSSVSLVVWKPHPQESIHFRYSKETIAHRRASQAAKLASGEYIILTPFEGRTQREHKFTLEIENIAMYLDAVSARDTLYSELSSESVEKPTEVSEHCLQDGDKEEFCSGIVQDAKEEEKIVPRLAYSFSDRIVYLAQVVGEGLLSGVIIYVQSQDDGIARGFCLHGGKFISVSAELSSLCKLEKPGDYFSQKTKLRDILIYENQTLPTFVLQCGELLSVKAKMLLKVDLSRKLEVDSKDREKISRQEPLRLDSPFHAFELLFGFLRTKIEHLLSDKTTERLEKCTRGQILLFCREVKLSMARYQYNFMMYTSKVLHTLVGSQTLLLTQIANNLSDSLSVVKVIQYWAQYALDIEDKLGCLCHGETWDYIE